AVDRLCPPPGGAAEGGAAPFRGEPPDRARTEGAIRGRAHVARHGGDRLSRGRRARHRERRDPRAPRRCLTADGPAALIVARSPVATTNITRGITALRAANGSKRTFRTTSGQK